MKDQKNVPGESPSSLWELSQILVKSEDAQIAVDMANEHLVGFAGPVVDMLNRRLKTYGVFSVKLEGASTVGPVHVELRFRAAKGSEETIVARELKALFHGEDVVGDDKSSDILIVKRVPVNILAKVRDDALGLTGVRNKVGEVIDRTDPRD